MYKVITQARVLCLIYMHDARGHAFCKHSLYEKSKVRTSHSSGNCSEILH